MEELKKKKRERQEKLEGMARECATGRARGRIKSRQLKTNQTWVGNTGEKNAKVYIEHWKTQVLTYAIFYPGC